MQRALYIALASALITTGAIKAAPALANEAGPVDSRIHLVRTADLDLGSESGRRKLDRRLAIAAREVCGTASGLDIEGRNAVRKCRDETLARARAQRATVVAGRGGGIAVAANR